TKAFRRDNHVGAWFIDAFIEVCRGSYEEDHLEEMLISVREKVAYGKHYRTSAGGLSNAYFSSLSFHLEINW
ncbi:hypothetical protein KUTeg_022126, partial [Tegillarca granosa]